MKTSDLNNSMQVLKENKLSVCKLPTPLPGRCSWLGTCKCLAPHLGLLPGKALRSIFVIFMAFCSCGSWSENRNLIPCAQLASGHKGGLMEDPVPTDSPRPRPTALLIVMPGAAQQTHRFQFPQAVRLCKPASSTLLWRPGTPQFLLTTKPVPNNSPPYPICS